MSAYDFLSDVVVLEAAQLGPSALGGLLADMGATVIKVEEPGHGDSVRYAGTYSVGDPENGFGFLHLRWNRGKKSIGLNLRDPEGVALFKQMVERADVVIEGMRARALDKLGLGFDDLKKVNPKIIFCSLSGLGRDGPYATMASHGPSFDCYGGLAAVKPGQRLSKWDGAEPPSIGMYGMGLPAAIGILAALHRAQRTGKGAMIEVAAADLAAQWLPETVDAALNGLIGKERENFADDSGRMKKWSRMENYRTKDDGVLYLMLFYDKYWDKFLKIIGREDLNKIYDDPDPKIPHDTQIQTALNEIIATKTRAEWLKLLHDNDVPVMPVNTAEQLVQDPHFLARKSYYTVKHPEAGELKLSKTPIRTPDQDFAPELAPALGENTDALLSSLLGKSADEIKALKSRGVVA